VSAPRIRGSALRTLCGFLLLVFPAGSSSETPEASLPAPGQVSVEVTQNRVTLVADNARRGRVLRDLANAAGFVVVPGQFENDPLTLEAIEVELEAILARVLEGIPYEVRYVFHPRQRRHLLTTVVVGQIEDSKKEIRRVRGRMRWRGMRRRAAAGALARALKDPDPAVRARASSRIRVRGPGLRKLGELLAHDPAPQVRSAAAQRLGSGNASSVSVLLPGLDDTEPSVVLAVLDALALVGDASLRTELEPLLEHPDPLVRERAAQVRHSLE